MSEATARSNERTSNECSTALRTAAGIAQTTLANQAPSSSCGYEQVKERWRESSGSGSLESMFSVEIIRERVG